MKPLTLVLTLVGIFFQHQLATATSYDTLYVRSDGSATWPCGTDASLPCKNIATAVAHANDYATTTIKVAQGDYAESISIYANLPANTSEQLSIEGGWNANFTAQNPDPALTRITPSGNNAIISIGLGTWENVDLRLSSLAFRGITNLQRIGIQASANNSTIDLTVEHCRVESFRGQGLSLYADNIADINISVTDTIIQGNFQYPSNEPWTGAGVSVASYNPDSVA